MPVDGLEGSLLTAPLQRHLEKWKQNVPVGIKDRNTPSWKPWKEGRGFVWQPETGWERARSSGTPRSAWVPWRREDEEG